MGERMNGRTREPSADLPERQGLRTAQAPPENSAPGKGQSGEHPAEDGPEREEAFSAEQMLRELEAALRDGAGTREKADDPRTDGGEPERGPGDRAGEEENPAQAAAGNEAVLTAPPAQLPASKEPPAPKAMAAAAPAEEHVTVRELLEELEASEEGARREKAGGAARDGKKTRRLRRRAAVFFALLLAALVVVFQFIGFAVIDGASMTPSLSEHDFLIYWKFPDEIGRGEVLLCRSEGYNGQILAKRVIGLPGEVVEVDEDGRVLLDGEPYAETTAVYGASEWGSDVMFPIRVEEGCYFVLGDNRAVSIDSRQSVIGQIPREDVIGRVLCWFHME